jgi:hypothetical protein
MLLFHIGRTVVMMMMMMTIITIIITVCVQFTLVEIPFAYKPFKI